MSRFHLMKMWVLIVVMVIVGIMMLLAIPSPFPSRTVYGVTFSQPHAEGIGLDWKEVYNELLTDLGVKYLRLSAYWDVIEPKDDAYDWSGLDYQMDRAAESGAQVILSIGRKVPRWPECHVPAWAQELSEEEQQDKVLEMLIDVTDRYKDHPALRMWQLENEAHLDFGICPPADLEFHTEEETVVRSVDTSNPILVTDSGELNSWLTASKFGDVLGTTMYRTVYSKRTEKPFHYDYIFPSWMYRLKSRYIHLLRGKDVIISELQGEPWASAPFQTVSREERRASITPERFIDLHDFADRTQLSEAYWWGVEYWYWEKETQGDDSYWKIAREMF